MAAGVGPSEGAAAALEKQELLENVRLTRLWGGAGQQRRCSSLPMFRNWKSGSSLRAILGWKSHPHGEELQAPLRSCSLLLPWRRAIPVIPFHRGSRGLVGVCQCTGAGEGCEKQGAAPKIPSFGGLEGARALRSQNREVVGVFWRLEFRNSRLSGLGLRAAVRKRG